MKPSIFMSYSRREVGFVDDLTHRLDKAGFKVWLDYRSLVPGTPWKDQITKGLDESDVILLVVSKESIASKNVEVEWRRVVREKKRIILVIFEAVDLPEELEKLEWVDFRGNYKTGLNALVARLEAQKPEEQPVPETGFKIPRPVWVAFALSLIIALFSVAAIWTVFLPWILLPLPYRILKRNFNFSMVQASLVILPFALMVSSMITTNERWSFDIFMIGVFSILFVIPIILMLRSSPMQRWGKPEATMPRFADRYRPNIPNPDPVTFFVDHAEPDNPVANELTRVLKKYHHPQAEEIHAAQTVFVLASAFKKETQADPEKQVVIPVILQTVKVAPEISKVQWIDFRGGVRNLNAMAQLLPEPDRLLQALGVRPAGNSFLLPAVILYLVYFIAFLAVSTFGLWLPYLYQFRAELLRPEGSAGLVPALVLGLIIFGVLCYFMVRGVVSRRGRFASVRMTIGIIIVLGLIITLQLFYSINFEDTIGALSNPNETRGLSTLVSPLIYLIGVIGMAVFMAIRARDVRMWFPARLKKKK